MGPDSEHLKVTEQIEPSRCWPHDPVSYWWCRGCWPGDHGAGAMHALFFAVGVVVRAA